MVHRIPTAALPLLLSSLVGGAASAATPVYVGDDLPPGAAQLKDDQLNASIKLNMGKLKVPAVLKGGAAVEPSTLPRPERVALMYIMGTQPGSELDVLVEDGGRHVPVELQWNDDGVHVASGAPLAQLYGKASPREDIQKKYGVGPFVDSGSTWDNDSLYVVETALSMLSPAELRGVAGLPFHRMPRDPSGKAVRGTAIAMYVPEKNQVELYDQAMVADRRRFLGNVNAPVLLSVATLIHEAGHAISRAGTRDLRRSAEQLKKEYEEITARVMAEKKQYDADRAEYQRSRDAALGKSLNERGAGLKALVEQMNAKRKQFEEVAAKMVATERSGSAMEQALDKQVPFRTSATLYGRTAIGESLADCFALFKADKAALQRAAPRATAFFESAEYQQLLPAQ